MKERVITGVVLIAILLGVYFAGSIGFNIFLAIVAVIAAYEVYQIKRESWHPVIFVILLAMLMGSLFLNFDKLIPILAISLISLLSLSVFAQWFPISEMSFVYMMGTILSLALASIQLVYSMNILIVAYILIATFATDICAYFGGTFFGKHKLIERVSPKKTVEGAVVGVIGSCALSLLFAFIFLVPEQILPIRLIIATSIVIPFVAQIGDLAFSLVKRHFNIKDFGYILPGHGGILDRVDSVSFALIFFVVVRMLVV